MKKILVLLLLSSCSGYQPDFYLFDRTNQQIINEQGNAVSFNDEAIDKYACMHEQKIVELYDYLKIHCSSK